MVVIRVLLQVKPEHQAAFLAYIARSAAQSREFDGCMNFGYYASVDDDSYFLLHEEWASQAQFDAYKSSETFTEIGQNI
ncbi:MAG: putative quinol monooxygenase, partial [Aggregatilineales bacterium]